MAAKTIDASMLRDMYLTGAALIERDRAGIDALNVFPVPDGDTGTNMSQTINTAVRDLSGKTFMRVCEVADRAAKGALKGARGNSGVILSQILRGFSKAMSDQEELTAQLFVKALRMGADTAYKAVIKPKEGTILTVARMIAEACENPRNKTDDCLELMNLIVRVGNDVLKKTPDMLPVLKQAGVVDSGGKGLMTMFAGFLSALKGESIDQIVDEAQEKPAEFVDDHSTLESITFAYCTEFIITRLNRGVGENDVSVLRRMLEKIGDCVLVIGDDDVIKVHVHTNNPGKALQLAVSLGELSAIKIENMLEQFRENQARRESLKADELKEFGIVAVALGDGLVGIFKDLMVDKVVDGGQTMNPSIDDLYQAIEQVPARQVFVLPNNTNIILAAQQAAELTEKKVYVLPTKSVPMGIAAAIAFMPELSGEENAQRMEQASQSVHTASITYAVRDTTFDEREIHQGDIMALVDNKISLLGHDVDEVAVSVLETMIDDDTEVITIYYGQDVTGEQASKLEGEISAKYPLCDVSLHEGGQPLYYYLIAVE